MDDDMEHNLDILKKNASMVRQSGVYLYKYADLVDEITNLLTNLLFISLPNSAQIIEEKMKKANAYLYLAMNNLNVLTDLIDNEDDTDENNE